MKSTLKIQVCFLVLFFSIPLYALEWSEEELNKIQQLFPENIPAHIDPSNRYINNKQAIKLGKRLFNEPLLSANRAVSCAGCHHTNKGFTDNRVVARGTRKGFRNTPTLLNVSEQNWFFWDGSKDSLWSQAMSSIENPSEHNFSRTEVLHFICNNRQYREMYERVFKQELPDDNALMAYPDKGGLNGNIAILESWKKLPRQQKELVNRTFSNIGKAIAAYVTTIKSPSTRFDHFVTQLLSTGHSQILNDSEQNGLKLFMSPEVGCSNCHSGSIFSNREFHNIGTGIRGIDNGRSEVIDAVIRDEYNCLGNYSDALQEECMDLLYANTDRHTLSGTFKTPTLRSVSKTAPYMHDGRYKSLYEVLDYYISVDGNMAQRTDLTVINVDKQEEANLVAFLKTL